VKFKLVQSPRWALLSSALPNVNVKTLQISEDFIKFSECQVPLRKFEPPVQDFLATVLSFDFTSFHATV